jgi:hypothetical protein
MRVRFLLAVGAVALAAPAARPADPDIELPPGLKPPFAIVDRPGRPRADDPTKIDESTGEWVAAVLSDDLPVYRTAAGAGQLPGPGPKFREVVHILAENRVPRRFLAARFEPGSRKFKGLIGWLDADWVMDDPTPLTVKAARATLQTCWPERSPERDLLDRMLPPADPADTGADDNRLKAVSHPTRGNFAFYRPVKAADFTAKAESARAEDGTPIQRFAFYYVARVVVRGSEAFAVLSARSEFSLHEPDAGGRLPLLGVVPLSNVVLVPSRLGPVPNFDPKAYAERMTRSDPVTLYGTEAQAEAAARGLDRDRTGKPVVAEAVEAVRPADKPPAPVPASSVGYLVLKTTTHPGPDGKPVKTYTLAAPATANGPEAEAGGVHDESLEKDRKKLLDATLQMRTVELVFVIDATGSMSSVFEQVLDAVKRYITQLQKSEAARDDMDRINLRVGVVLYKDRCDGPDLVQHSPDYFDVMDPKGAGMAAFGDYMAYAKRRCGGGGDPLERPFDGLRRAGEYFFGRSAGSKHLSGAATVAIVMGDVGNHPAVAEDDLTADKVVNLLSDRDAAGQFPRVVVHPVLVKWAPDHPLQPWTDQMQKLADGTGGVPTAMDFHGPADIPYRLTEHLQRTIDARRALAAKEREGIARMFARTGDGDGTPVLRLDVNERMGKARLEEIIPPADLEAIRKRLGGTVFAFLHTPERRPGDTRPRWQHRVLLTKKEIERLKVKFDELADDLNRRLGRVPGGGDRKPDQAYAEMLMQTLVIVLGDRALTAEDRLKWRTAPWSDIEAALTKLPIRLDCLKDLKRDGLTKNDLVAVRDKLRDSVAKLTEALEKQPPIPGVVATGDLHLAIDPTTLP